MMFKPRSPSPKMRSVIEASVVFGLYVLFMAFAFSDWLAMAGVTLFFGWIVFMYWSEPRIFAFLKARDMRILRRRVIFGPRTYPVLFIMAGALLVMALSEDPGQRWAAGKVALCVAVAFALGWLVSGRPERF